MLIKGLKILMIRERGAIQPCQIPQRKLAGAAAVALPSPGMQPVNTSMTMARRRINTAFFFILNLL